MESLKGKLDEKDAQMEKLKGRLDEKDAQIGKLREQTDRREEKIEKLEAEMEKLRAIKWKEMKESGLPTELMSRLKALI